MRLSLACLSNERFRWASRPIPKTVDNAPSPRSKAIPLPIRNFQRRLAGKPLSVRDRIGLAKWLHSALSNPLPQHRSSFPWITPNDLRRAFAHQSLLESLSPKSNGELRSISSQAVKSILWCTEKCLQIVKGQNTNPTSSGIGGTVKEWRILLNSPEFTQMRLLSTLNLLQNHNNLDTQNFMHLINISYHSTPMPQQSFLRFLHLVAHKMPTLSMRRPLPCDKRQDKLSLSIPLDQPGPSVREAVASSSATEHPRAYLLLFEALWRDMVSRGFQPTSAAYRSALVMETKLAHWRSLRRRVDPTLKDVWQPVKDIILLTKSQGMLDISHINQVLWSILRYAHPDGQVWHSVDAAMALYGRLQTNAVDEEPKSLLAMKNRSDLKFIPHHLGFLHTAQSSTLNAADRVRRPEEALLGLAELPEQYIPSRETYELMVKGLVIHGELEKAMMVFQDMTSTQQRKSDKLEGLRGDVQPSIATFDSLFRGFARYGVPSNLMAWDPNDPGKAIWELPKDVESAWTVDVLQELFEDFLNLLPAKPPEHREGNQTALNDAHTRQQGSYTFSHRDFSTEQSVFRDAPSPQQLFFALIALRRASGDHHEWVLAQWARVEKKFGFTHEPPGRKKYEENMKQINSQGWAGFHINDRLRRTLTWLQDAVEDSDR